MAFNKNRVMDAARRYVEKGQTDKAIKEYLRVVKEDPKDVRVWLKIGDLYAKKGAKADAIDTYLKVAKFYSEQGFYLKAVAVYKQIVKLDPRLIEVNLKLAELYRQLGLMSDAMRHFEMVAGHFHREGKTKEAMATVRQLVELDPDNVATRIKLAELYSKEGMVEEAVTEFTNACEYLRANNRQDDFIKVAERLLWHRPDMMDLNRELATLYLRRNDPRRALQKLQVCFKANSRDVDTLALLAQAFQALEQKSKTVQVLKELARVLDEDGKRDRAKEVHRKILAFVPNDPDSLAYVGQKSKAQSSQARQPEAPGGRPPPPPPPPDAKPRLVVSRDVPPRRTHNPTGSMPLVDAQAISDLSQASKNARPKEPVAKESSTDFTSDFTQDSSLVEGSAAAERHSEEIAKLLTETEVYVKYGLHQKAIDHLRRVFDFDHENIDARERLKEILLEQGREKEAMEELMQLAEISAVQDRERAVGYLRELLAIDGTFRPAFEIAERHNLDLTGESEDIEIVGDFERTDLRDGNVAPVEEDIDFADIDFEEDAELIVEAGSTNEQPQLAEEIESFEFELDDAVDGGAGVTRQLGVAGSGGNPQEYPYTDPDGQPPLPEPVFDPEDAAAFDAEPGFDPRDAAAFDAEAGLGPAGSAASDAGSFEPGATTEYSAFGLGGQQQTAEFNSHGFEGEPPPTTEYSSRDYLSDAGVTDEFSGLEAEPLLDMGEFSVDFDMPSDQRPTQDLSGARTQETPAADFDEKTRAGNSLTDTNLDLLDERIADQPPGFQEDLAVIEDELEEADFYIAQNLFDDARDIINNLLARYPEHPLLIAKLQDVDRMAGAGGDSTTTATMAPELDFEELDNLDEFEAATAPPGDPMQQGSARPSVMLENPVEEGDADTHYDLGLAYKEMGLYDEAIQAFTKVTESPGREVQSRLMLGLCHREQGNLTDAIQQFKAGLHAPAIVEREQLSLYYEIAISYEALGDSKEAAYFYEAIRKKDPDYRDVAQRLSALASGASSRDRGHVSPTAEDAEAAIDSLLAESDGSGRGGG